MKKEVGTVLRLSLDTLFTSCFTCLLCMTSINENIRRILEAKLDVTHSSSKPVLWCGVVSHLDQVEGAEEGDKAEPEPEEDEDLLVEQVDGQHTLDGPPATHNKQLG